MHAVEAVHIVMQPLELVLINVLVDMMIITIVVLLFKGCVINERT